MFGSATTGADVFAAADIRIKPERGAKLRVLRWKPFVAGDLEAFEANTRKFSEQTGVEVKIETETWENLRARTLAVAAMGAGPDIIFGTNDDPHVFPEKLLILSDLAEYLGAKYGGWYDIARSYATHGGRWIALPQGVSALFMNYRIRHMNAAGFETFPRDLPGFLRLCRNLKKNGTPAGFSLGHAPGDANSFAHWCLWAHGGRVVDATNTVVLDAPETIAALHYARQLHEALIWGTLSWVDATNNRAFLAEEISLTANSISIYAAARDSADPRLRRIAADMDYAHYPVGPVGRPTQQNPLFLAFAFDYTPYPNAAREYLRFMWEAEQYGPWLVASKGFITQPLTHYESSPVWTADPKTTIFRGGFNVMLPTGYAGMLGIGSTRVLGDFVVVDMFAEVCSGARTPREAARRAAERARRYYAN